MPALGMEIISLQVIVYPLCETKFKLIPINKGRHQQRHIYQLIYKVKVHNPAGKKEEDVELQGMAYP